MHTSQALAKQSQLPSGAGRDEAKGTWDEGQIRRTKPIWTRRPETGARRQTRGPSRGSIVQNEANCPKRGTEAVSTIGPVARGKNFDRVAAGMW